MKRILFQSASAFVIFLIPAFAWAALVPCAGGSACQACHLAELGNKIVDFLIYIGVAIAAIIFMYAGFEMVTSQGNMSKVKHAKETFLNVFIGIVIALTAWLVIDLTMQLTIGGELEIGPWNTIKCEVVTTITRPGEPNWESMGGAAPGTPGASIGVDGRVIPGQHSSIIAAAEAYAGADTSAGPAGGRLACAWAVNNILVSAGQAPLDANYVPYMEDALRGGRGTQVTQTTARAGDIVIQGDQGHVGICANDGCTRVYSNSSSRAQFNGTYSNVNMNSPLPSRIYRVN